MREERERYETRFNWEGGRMTGRLRKTTEQLGKVVGVTRESRAWFFSNKRRNLYRLSHFLCVTSYAPFYVARKCGLLIHVTLKTEGWEGEK